MAREARQEAAELGIELLVAEFLATEALAWTAAGDYAAARLPAMEAVEIARRIRNPLGLAAASLAAAEAIWRSEPQAALLLIEDTEAPVTVTVLVAVTVTGALLAEPSWVSG